MLNQTTLHRNPNHRPAVVLVESILGLNKLFHTGRDFSVVIFLSFFFLLKMNSSILILKLIVHVNVYLNHQMECNLLIILQAILVGTWETLVFPTLRAVGFSYAKRERNHCEQPSAFPSSMHELVTPHVMHLQVHLSITFSLEVYWYKRIKMYLTQSADKRAIQFSLYFCYHFTKMTPLF